MKNKEFSISMTHLPHQSSTIVAFVQHLPFFRLSVSGWNKIGKKQHSRMQREH
jgi:hypothetical protein